MKKFIALTGCLFFLCCILQKNCCAQAHVQYSHRDADSSCNVIVKIVNGEAYVLQGANGFGFVDAKLKKYAVEGPWQYSPDICLIIRRYKRKGIINDLSPSAGSSPTVIL